MISGEDIEAMRPDDIDLTPAQNKYILHGEHPSKPSTWDALERKGLINSSEGWPHNRGLTDLGMAYVTLCMDKSLEWLIKQLPDGTPLIHTDLELLKILSESDDNDVYVYRGNQPLVVRDGNGQKPLAALHPYYRWQIEVARTHGKFLRRYSIIGHKGSYGYAPAPTTTGH